MNWLTNILGLGRVVSDVATVFQPHAENEAERTASIEAKRLAAFAMEFNQRQRTWFDGMVDGANRLPRPMMAFGVLWLFYHAMSDPVSFTGKMVGLSAIPEPMWWLLGAVVSFYFGAREIAKYQESTQRFSARDVSQMISKTEVIVDANRTLAEMAEEPVLSAAATSPQEEEEVATSVEKTGGSDDFSDNAALAEAMRR